MINFKEYIVNDIEEKKVLIDLLPKNTIRRKEKFIETVEEIKEKYQNSKDSVQKFINYKYDKLLPKKMVKSTEEEEKELTKLNELLILGNPLTTFYEKMGFDLLLYDLMHYYDNPLEEVNKTITQFITKINDVSTDLISLNDFKLNVYSYIYIKNIYDNFITKKVTFNNDTFETIYWKCPKVIEYIIINLRMILRKNEKKINNYVLTKYKYKMNNYGFNTYEEVEERVKYLKNIIEEKKSPDEYDIINMAFEGKLDINSLMNGKDSDCNFFMIQQVDLSVKKNYEKFINTIKTLKYGLEEYLVYLEYKNFLDEFKKKYSKYITDSEKNSKSTEVKNKLNEILKLENQLLKLRVNKYVSNLSELESSLKQRDNDKIFNQEVLFEKLYKQYTELNNIYFEEKIKSYIKVNTYVSDVFAIYDAYPYFNKKMIKKVFQVEDNDEIDNIRDKMKNFIYNLPKPYRDIIERDWIIIFANKVPGELFHRHFVNINDYDTSGMVIGGYTFSQSRIVYINSSMESDVIYKSFVHEIGHIISFEAGTEHGSETWEEIYRKNMHSFDTDGYNLSNEAEFFASCFEEYYNNTDHLKTYSMEAYDYFKALLKQDLKNETFFERYIMGCKNTFNTLRVYYYFYFVDGNIGNSVSSTVN
jgi:hypothetical protein